MPNNDRPYVICHMLSSIDGRIDGDFFSLPETGIAGQVASRIRTEYACDSVLNGTVTAAEIYADGYVRALPETSQVIPCEDWIAPHDVRQYAIALDAKGTLNWQGGTIRRKGKAPAHAVTLLTEMVSDAYLSFLRQQGVSYLFAGKDSLDLPLAMCKLQKELGIGRLLLTGGGVINWAMLENDLIDELSIVISPAIDGAVGTATMFDQSAFSLSHLPVAFKLKDVRRDEGDVVWLNYVKKENAYA